jgi:hypothetical protein
MVPGIQQISASESAELSRTVPVQPPVSYAAQAVPPPGSEPEDKFQPVRIGPLFEVATSEQDEDIAKSDQRVELDAYYEKLSEDRNADSRALQQKLYSQF